MAVGTRHKFTMIIFTQERGRCKPCWSKNTKIVLRRLHTAKHDRNKCKAILLAGAKAVILFKLWEKTINSQVLPSRSLCTCQDPKHLLQLPSCS